jgi:hypothetical protein
MAVPLAALLIFYSARARRERLHPETEAGEPLMTCAEYDALMGSDVAETASDADTQEQPEEISEREVAENE